MSNPKSNGSSSPGRDSDENTVQASEVAASRNSILERDVLDGVDYGGVVIARDEAGADTLDLMRPGGTAGKDGRSIGLDSDYLDVGFLFLEEFTGTGNSTARTDPGDEEVDVTVGGLPDLGPGGIIVGSGVGGVGKLVESNGAGSGAANFVGPGDRTFHTLGSRSENNLGTESGNDHTSFATHRFGHCENKPVTASSANQSKADPGVTTGGLDDSTALMENTTVLGVVDHSQSDTILDATAGIEVLDLSEDTGGRVVESRPVRKLHEGSVADERSDIFHTKQS